MSGIMRGMMDDKQLGKLAMDAARAWDKVSGGWASDEPWDTPAHFKAAAKAVREEVTNAALRRLEDFVAQPSFAQAVPNPTCRFELVIGLMEAIRG